MSPSLPGAAEGPVKGEGIRERERYARHRRIILSRMRAYALAAAVLVCAACAHRLDPVDADRFPASRPLGTVAVTVSPPGSPPSISAPSRLRSAGVTALEAAAGTTVVLTFVAGPYGTILGILISPVTASVGAITGAIKGPDPSVVDTRVAALQQAVATFDLPDALARAVVAAGRPDRPALVREESTDAPSGVHIDTRLALDTIAVVLENRRLGDASSDPALTLVVRAHVRLVSVADSRTLFERSLERVSPAAWYFSEWAADNGRLLSQQLGIACDTLAAQIVDELL
jgi:hypothetical protein